MNVLRTVKGKIYTKASKHISHAMLIEGVLKGTDHSLRCLFIDNSNLTGYIADRMYEGPPRILRKWRIWNPTLKNLIVKNNINIDMCVAVLPRQYDSYFQNLYDYKTNEWVNQVIDTSGSLQDIVGAFHQKKRQMTNKLISKSSLIYRISHDLNDFKHFYNRMYLPLVHKRYGSLPSYIFPYEQLKQFFMKGFLLLVLEGDCAISGCICFVENDEILNFHSSGVLDDQMSYIKMGAQLALYYFNILYAKDHGIKKVNTMKSRFFLNDGVYRTKRELGAHVQPDDESESWVYFFNLGTLERVVHFYAQNPIIVHTKEGLKGVIGVENSFEPTAERKKYLNDQFCDPGLEGLILLSPRFEAPIDFSFNR